MTHPLQKLTSRRAGLTFALLVMLTSLSVEAGQAFGQQPVAKPGSKPIVSFNETFVHDLYAKVDIKNPDAVFALVFSKLKDEVTVYPSENYFYWSFNANGKPIWGNFRLDAVDRDKGILHVGYFEYDENAKFQDRDGFDKDFGPKDGVIVKKVERFVYAVTYKGRTVRFRLHDVGMAPPRKAKLRSDEAYVGPVFDESGIKFFLIFNKTVKHFIFMLNEDGFVAETFRPIKGKPIAIGRRTGFAYYLDREYTRKILIAVNGVNAQRNNYYDGPFDQLPDNYVDQTNIRKYIVMAYPEYKGKIDKFGGYLDQKGARVAINPYFIYYDEEQLSFVGSCAKTHLTKVKAGDPAPRAKFYKCITPDT